MAKNHILKVGIIIAAIACITNSLQAQSWTTNNIITVNSNLSTDLEAQKVKPYGEHFLIGLSNVMGTDRYCFTVWEDGNGAIAMGCLNPITTVVSDFVIFEDVVYFCGKDYSSGTDVGIIGRFNIQDLIGNGGNFQYEITDIQATQHLTKLVAYKMDVDTNITHVVAIGNNGLSSANPARLVCMDNAINPSFDYSVLTISSLSGDEVLEDLTVDHKYVHTVSRIYVANRFSVRCFLGHNPLDQLYYQDHYEFTLSAPTGLYYPIFDYTYPSHITMLQQDYLAVGVSGFDTQGNSCTMVNILHIASPNVLSTQLIYHENKVNKILEMDYSQETNRLLLLNNSEFEGQGQYQTITHLDLSMTSPYMTTREMPASFKHLNHLSVIPHHRYAIAGMDASGANYQTISVKEINYQSNSCYTSSQIQTGTLSGIPGTFCLQPTVIIPQTPANWNSSYSLGFTGSWHINCSE